MKGPLALFEPWFGCQDSGIAVGRYCRGGGGGGGDKGESARSAEVPRELP